jgi:hypothetical protein
MESPTKRKISVDIGKTMKKACRHYYRNTSSPCSNGCGTVECYHGWGEESDKGWITFILTTWTD